MEMLWFYIAVILAISDEVHTQIFWKLFFDFYVLLAGLIHEITNSNIAMWIVHELLEAVFHFVLLSILFLSLEIGFLAATIHLVVDLYQEAAGLEMNRLQHRALHFVIESFFFIMVLGL
ncbi:MAG: hypothetical protein A4E25_01392 [Methanobacterium sp. PtaB.Bin024]|jgi:hypothetical protein|nr:MAG: hypothetical protein A4E25_01392 [Methanobacterium sp. PtaB.Bin024]